MSISTKNGDNGDTSLFDGTRIGKNSTTIEAIGISDELNAYIGFIQSKKVAIVVAGQSTHLADISGLD